VVEQKDHTFKSTPFFVQFNTNPHKERKKVKIWVNDKRIESHMWLEPEQLRCFFSEQEVSETNDAVHKEEKEKGSAVESTSKKDVKEAVREVKKKEPQLDRNKRGYLFRAFNYFFPEEELLDRMENDKGHALDQLTPTSKEVEVMNLKPGLNKVKYVLDGDKELQIPEQTINGSIFRWLWHERIALCDIDGTVTKSDTMGLITTAVGYYSYVHPGICSLLSSLDSRGYRVLYLTARSITQGARTREFIESIRQEQDSRMPHGPILTSYNNILHAAVREYVLYRSETFKIDALKGIQALFPKDSKPFVVGLGNKPTDHESYATIGIPVENIFLIDPYGKVKGLKSKDEYQYTGYEEVQHMLTDLLPNVITGSES
jgi:phosphatidate phosphatase PAH1